MFAKAYPQSEHSFGASAMLFSRVQKEQVQVLLPLSPSPSALPPSLLLKLPLLWPRLSSREPLRAVSLVDSLSLSLVTPIIESEEAELAGAAATEEEGAEAVAEARILGGKFS